VSALSDKDSRLNESGSPCEVTVKLVRVERDFSSSRGVLGC